MKPKSDVEFAAFVGIDWANAKHDMCLQPAGGEEREWVVVPHRPAAIDAWASTLRQRFNGCPVAVCLELAKGPLVYALQKYDFLVLFPVNPATLAKYREAFTPSRAKADPTDAELALEKSTASQGLLAVQPNEPDLYGYVDENLDAVRAFTNGRPALLDWAYGREIVRLTMAAYLSAEEGRAAVREHVAKGVDLMKLYPGGAYSFSPTGEAQFQTT